MNAAWALLAVVLAAPPVEAVSQGSPHVRAIAITFDAGADRGYAGRILSTLEHNHIHATFGMTGQWARANPDLLRRMVRDGDGLINHTYDHRSFTGVSSHTYALSVKQRTWEIVQAQRVIERIAHRSPRPFFRPPFGDYDAATEQLLRRLGYRYMIMWTVDSLGWDFLPAPQIIVRCLSLATPGAIIAMHVGSQSQDALALQAVITGLKRRHYAFLTVSALVSER